MKNPNCRKVRWSTFLPMACVALVMPCASLGEVKITASRDYVDKKVAAATNALHQVMADTATNLAEVVAQMSGKADRSEVMSAVASATNALQGAISNAVADIDVIAQAVQRKADASKIVVNANTGVTNTESVAYTDDVRSSVATAVNALGESVGNQLSYKQNALSELQMAAVNSGINNAIWTNVLARIDSIEGDFVSKDEFRAMVVDIVTNLYGNVFWRSDDGGKTMDAYYRSDDEVTNLVQGVNSYLRTANGRVEVYSDSANAPQRDDGPNGSTPRAAPVKAIAPARTTTKQAMR